MVNAQWSTADARWLVEIERADTGERITMSCGWFFCASGYYRYDEGFTLSSRGGTASGPGRSSAALARGPDYSGKRVVIIGSGATGGHVGAGDGGHCRARDDAAAITDVYRAGAVRGPDREYAAEAGRPQARMRSPVRRTSPSSA